MLADARGMPLVKVIEAGDGGASSFQFAHLSFQEGLFAKALADGSAADAVRERLGSSHRKLLDNPWFLNALTIGGSAVGAKLCVDDENLTLKKAEVNAMVATQWAPLGSERQSLELRGLRDVDDSARVNAVKELATYLTRTKSIRKLEYAPATSSFSCLFSL